jgi:hypothetical protein
MKKKRTFNGPSRNPLRWASLALSRWTLLLSACTMLLSISGEAQYPPDSFAYQSSLDTVRQAAFYRIALAPWLVAKCRQDLADLRIADQDGKLIPYVLKSDLPVLSTEGFREFPILSNQRIKDSTTEVVIENRASAPLNYLLLLMQNSNAHRTATLSGSDDQKKWYAIREHIGLEEAGSDTADHFVQSVTFPSSSYHYFKMILDDKGLLPLHILKAGIYTQSFTIGMYREVPNPVIRQKDSSDKHSYVTLSYKESYRIDKLDLGIRGPALYKRYARIYEEDTSAKSMVLVSEVALDPANSSFRIPPVRTSRLLIDISNKDNSPLLVQSAATGQLDQYLLAYLQPGLHYRLLAGNTHATAPEYDLKYFVDTVGKDLAEVRAGPPQRVLKPATPTPLPAKDHSGILLWSIITGVLLLLLLMSVKMVKAIPKKDE